MQKKRLVHTLLIALLAGATGIVAGCPASRAPRRNLILITVDSLRADRVGYAGHAGAKTPAIDGLAARGTTFTMALSPAPEAVPSLASLHTGRYPSSHGLLTERDGALPEDAETLAESLAREGYKTGAVAGAITLHEKYGLDQGFASYEADFSETPRPSVLPDAGFSANRVVDFALGFLESARYEPFFLWVNFHDPHYFYRPPEPWLTDFADHPYDGEVAYVDTQIKRILDKLRDYGIEETTIVVLAGTNGEGLADGGEEYHGTTLSAATTRVPLVVVAPRFAAAARNETPVSLVDIASTAAALLGTQAPAGAEGVSLLSPPDASRAIFLEAWMPARLFGWAPLRGVVSGSWKYVEGRRGELYDLAGGTGPVEPSGPLAEVRDRLAAELARRAPQAETAARAASQREPPEGEADRTDLAALGLSDAAVQEGDIDPRDQVVAANDALRGMRSAWRKRLAAAEEMFAAVLARDPANYTALLDSALLKMSRSDVEGAKRGLEKTQAMYPGAAEVYHQLGHLTLDGTPGGTERAGRLFALATRIDPMNEEALYDLACAQATRGERDLSFATLEQAVAQGFRDFDWMHKDTDLESLRADPRFETIAGKPPAVKPGGAATP